MTKLTQKQLTDEIASIYYALIGAQSAMINAYTRLETLEDDPDVSMKVNFKVFELAIHNASLEMGKATDELERGTKGNLAEIAQTNLGIKQE